MNEYDIAAAYIKERIAVSLGDFRPEVLLVLGSGLGFLGDRVEARTCVSYADIPHFRASTAPGHEGRFVFGELRGKRAAVMQGRMHCYEGYTMEDAAYACRVIRLLGAKTMIVTNAAGAVNTDCPVCKNDLNGCKGKEKPTETEKPAEPEKPKKETGSVGTILFILAALLAVGGIGYYVKIVRPKQQAEDDAEFEDDGYGEGFDPDEAYGEP